MLKLEDFTCSKAVGCLEMSIFRGKNQDIPKKKSPSAFFFGLRGWSNLESWTDPREDFGEFIR